MKGFILSVAILCCTLPIISPVHSGRTDGNGGHYNHSTGEYHYHHGYPAHQHHNGECPYDVQEGDEEYYDCGREGCEISKPHYHSNKATTTTTTARTQKQENDRESKNSSNNLLVDLCFCLIIVGIIVYGNFDKIKDFISKRRKNK